MSTSKPSQSEDEYFAREEAEKKRRLTIDRARQMAEDERERLRQLHANHCPKCGMHMHEIPFRGVMISKCFNCQGMFFEKEELEKVMGASGFWEGLFRVFSRKDYEDRS